MAPNRVRTPSQQRRIDALEREKEIYRKADQGNKVFDNLATGVLVPADVAGIPAAWRGIHGAVDFASIALPLLAADYAVKAVTGKDPRSFNKHMDSVNQYYDSIKLDKGYLAHAPTWVKNLSKGKDYAMEMAGASLVPTLGPIRAARLAASPAYRAAYSAKLMARPALSKGRLITGGALTAAGLAADSLAQDLENAQQLTGTGKGVEVGPGSLGGSDFRALYKSDPAAAMRLLNTIREPVTGRLLTELDLQSLSTTPQKAKTRPSKLHQALTNKTGWMGTGAVAGGLGTYGLMRRFGSKRWAVPAALGGATIAGVLAGALNDHLKKERII